MSLRFIVQVTFQLKLNGLSSPPQITDPLEWSVIRLPTHSASDTHTLYCGMLEVMLL